MTFDASQFNLYREVFRIVKRFNRGAVGEILEIFESRRLELIQFKKEIARLNTDWTVLTLSETGMFESGSIASQV